MKKNKNSKRVSSFWKERSIWRTQELYQKK